MRSCLCLGQAVPGGQSLSSQSTAGTIGHDPPTESVYTAGAQVRGCAELCCYQIHVSRPGSDESSGNKL